MELVCDCRSRPSGDGEAGKVTLNVFEEKWHKILRESMHEFPFFSSSFMAGEYPHVVTDTNVKIPLPNNFRFFHRIFW